jgi:hypothetical protein
MPQAYSLLQDLNLRHYLPVVNAEFDMCHHCGNQWWRFRLVDVKSDEHQKGMVARTAYRLNQSMGIAEQMVNMIHAWQSVPHLNPPASDYIIKQGPLVALFISDDETGALFAVLLVDDF